MKILLFSTLLALAAAGPWQKVNSDNGEVRKPGMCFEEYFKLHPGEFEKAKEKMVKSIEGRSDDDGKEPWHLVDFSKLSRCSADGECNGEEKCCGTMCGMRCIKPIFEHHRVDDIRNNLPSHEHPKKGAELTPRQKRHASEDSSEQNAGGEPEEDQGNEREKRSAVVVQDGSEDSSEHNVGGEPEEDQGNEREKRSVAVQDSGKEKGKKGHDGKGKKGHGGKGKGEGKNKGEGKGKGGGGGKAKKNGKGSRGGKGEGGKNEDKEQKAGSV